MAGPGTATARPWVDRYPVSVPRDLTVPDVRWPDLVEESVKSWPGRAAFVYYGTSLTYARFWELTDRFAAALAEDGLRAGDRIAIFLPNHPTYPIAYVAALRLGLTVVQVSPLYLGQDLVHLLADAQPKAIVTLEILYPELDKVRHEVSVPLEYVARLSDFYPFYLRPFVRMVARRQGRSTAVPSRASVRAFRTALAHPPGGWPKPPAVPPSQEVAVLQYTGGTTGRSKAAMLSHRNLVANALQCRAWFNVQDPGTAVVLAAIPLFHVYGMTVALNYPLLEGATIVLELRPEPTEILRLVNRYHPTELPGVPALYQAILHHPHLARTNVKSIRVCVSGSAPLPLEVARQFEAVTGGYLIEGYGLTEASPVTHANPIQGERRAGSIGLPLPLTDQRIVDAETGRRDVPVGEVGELAVKGPQVMLGYYEQPAETAKVLQDGWLLTGDLAKVDADGYAYIVERKKDMIDVGGLKVYPREVEEVLYQHPGVREAAVIGVPDQRLGEYVHAVIVRKDGATIGADDLIAFVRERIAHYKAPRSIQFRSELPRSGVQKVLRRVLREQATFGAPPAPPPTTPGR